MMETQSKSRDLQKSLVVKYQMERSDRDSPDSRGQVPSVSFH